MFKLHFTEYDNHSDIPSWGGGYGNIFQDERDVKFMVIAPFTIQNVNTPANIVSASRSTAHLP